jgi:hypothetical protein
MLRFVRGGLVALLGLLLGAVSPAAEAGSIISVDVGTQLDADSGAVASPAFGLRAGREVDLAVARITPEGGVVGVPETSFVGVIGGVRASIGRMIEPGAYLHLGYGGTLGEPGWLTSDAGLALDLALPHIRVGIHGGAEVRGNGNGGRPEPWLTAGVHTGVEF